METNQAREEGTISYSRRGEIPIYPVPKSCFHPEAGGSSNHWYLNSWDTIHWFATCQTLYRVANFFGQDAKRSQSLSSPS